MTITVSCFTCSHSYFHAMYLCFQLMQVSCSKSLVETSMAPWRRASSTTYLRRKGPAHWPRFAELPPSYKLSSTLCSCVGCKVRGSPIEGQVFRVEQPTCAGWAPYMGLGIRSYIPGAWFTHVMLMHMHNLLFMIHVSVNAFASCAQLVRIARHMLWHSFALVIYATVQFIFTYVRASILYILL